MYCVPLLRLSVVSLSNDPGKLPVVHTLSIGPGFAFVYQ